MDEEKQGFSIPPKKSLFDEPEVDSVEIEAMQGTGEDFIASFENTDGTKAVNVAAIETDIDGNFVGTLDNAEMDDYAQGLMDGEIDTRNLQVGDIYEGEDALADAEADADELRTKFAPMPDASDEEKAQAITDAIADASGEEEAEEDFEDIEEEPMFKQMNGEEKKPGGAKPPMGVEDLALPMDEEM